MGAKMKILLIKPYAYTPSQSIDIPLGILSLSAYLKRHLNESVDIRMLDLRIEPDREKALIDELDVFRPHVIGISTLAFEQRFLTKGACPRSTRPSLHCDRIRRWRAFPRAAQAQIRDDLRRFRHRRRLPRRRKADIRR